MAKTKENSTMHQNRQAAELLCPITFAMNKIGGHWKATILYHLMNGPKRYGELKKIIPGITEKMLAQHLKQLREDDLISKTVQQVKPPITIYNLTPAAEELSPVLLGMADWAIKNSDKFQNPTEVE
jgi:DNA-binding HxlR family transcriptional regulator